MVDHRRLHKPEPPDFAHFIRPPLREPDATNPAAKVWQAGPAHFRDETLALMLPST